MKHNKAQLKQLQKLIKMGGIVKVSEWTYSFGKYSKRKKTPPFCAEIAAWDVISYPNNHTKLIKKYIDDNPRVKYVIAVVDVRAANKAIKRLEA